MNLDKRLLALVQGIGADIKALLARTTPFIGRTTAVQSTSSTALANITNLIGPVAANSTYRVTGRIIFQSSGLTAGAVIGFAGPTNSNGLFVIAIPTTALISTGTATVRTMGSSGSGTTTSVVAIGTSMVATIDGILTVGNTSGNLALQFASSSALGTVSIQPGSTLVLEKLN